MKKTYMKPATRVVALKRPSLLSGSGQVGTTSVRMQWNESANNDEEGL
ncbi:MAG: hypothetical protein II886_08710 [Prevotella sp.]|nr:hypothetical protein [Prevotella sp.]